MNKRDPNHPTKLAILQFIIAYKMANDGIAPALDEIAEGVERGKTAVHAQLQILRAEGSISFLDDQPRTIQVTGGQWSMMA